MTSHCAEAAAMSSWRRFYFRNFRWMPHWSDGRIWCDFM